MDCADSAGLIEIQDSPGRGRDLFTMKPVVNNINYVKFKDFINKNKFNKFTYIIY
jgi:hypothetical protein